MFQGIRDIPNRWDNIFMMNTIISQLTTVSSVVCTMKIRNDTLYRLQQLQSMNGTSSQIISELDREEKYMLLCISKFWKFRVKLNTESDVPLS